MLGPTYRFTVYNATGQTLAANAVTIKPRRWKYGTDGSLTDEASGTADMLAQTATLLSAAYKTGTTQDNTTTPNKYIGGIFEIKVTAPVSSNGNVTIFLERSVDGGTTWPDNGRGGIVKTLTFIAAGTQYYVLEIE